MKRSLRSENYAVFLELLRAVRDTAAVTQTDLAQRLQVQQSDVSKCERGVRLLDLTELHAWLSALDTSFTEFCTELDRRLLARQELRGQANRVKRSAGKR